MDQGFATLPVDCAADPGSFRDRRNVVFRSQEGRIFRALDAVASQHWELLSSQPFFQTAVSRGSIVRTWEGGTPPASPVSTDATPTASPSSWTSLLEHEPIPFVSYPYEWSFGMLRDAALLHLELMASALDASMILKDSSAYNIQWQGARPVFIDIASFEKHAPEEPWIAYRQFCSHFLYPLMLTAYRGVGFHPWLRGDLEGISPQDMASLMNGRARFRSGVPGHVFLQARLQSHFEKRQVNERRMVGAAGFSRQLIIANVRKLRKLIASLQWSRTESEWSSYRNQNSYSEADDQEKVAFVDSILSRWTPATTWDLGANTGRFSRIAAKHSKYVLAFDSDHLSVDLLYRAMVEEKSTNVLPLVMNLANPSPSQGWRSMERRALGDRGRPDASLALALIHHLVIGANALLPSVIEWFASLGGNLIIEWVERHDPMVERLLTSRDEPYEDYDRTLFENELRTRFVIEEERTLPSGRRSLFACRPK